MTAIRIEDALVQFGVLSLKHGDILTVMCKERLSVSQAIELRHRIQPLVPEGVRVLVLDEGVEIAKVIFE